MFKGVNSIAFARAFPDNDACMQYLADKKWAAGFRCHRCGHHKYVKGKTSFHRRCSSCLYDESAMVHTIYQDMHIPLLKAFQMAFKIACKKKGMSTVELAADVGVQQKTAWFFKRKVQAAMRKGMERQYHFNPTDFVAHVIKQAARDKKKTRSTPAGKNKKSKLAIALPLDMVYEGQSYEAMFERVQRLPLCLWKEQGTPHWPGYLMLLKNWLRGIHHKCSKKLFFAYYDEHSFRFDNRKARKTIFDKTITSMMQCAPHPYKVLKHLCASST